jgi:30S ribosomal protein 3
LARRRRWPLFPPRARACSPSPTSSPPLHPPPPTPHQEDDLDALPAAADLGLEQSLADSAAQAAQSGGGVAAEAAAQTAVAEALALAALEQDFVGSAADADTASYLQRLSDAAAAAALSAASAGVESPLIEAALGPVAERLGAGAPEPRVLLEALGTPLPIGAVDDDKDVLADVLDSEAAGRAIAAARSLKLSRDELAALVPADWDGETTEWFSPSGTVGADGRPVAAGGAAGGQDALKPPAYRLNILWADQNLGVSVDQVFARGGVAPLTEYFFWPRRDAWEELRVAVEARPWVSEADKVDLLNRLTKVINMWQDVEGKPSVEDARLEFPDCVFLSRASAPAPAAA